MSKTASVLSISALFLLVICDDIDGAIVATVGIEIEVSDNVTFKELHILNMAILCTHCVVL